MLAPQERQPLLDALRPPEDYRFDRAIGTTFTVDLLALLIAPLAFSKFDWQDERGNPPADLLVQLEALRRTSGRIRIFCQSGYIQVPARHSLLFHYLEQSVIEVAPPIEGGVFHPKLWLLRFVADAGTVRYRLLNLSRNLTFDRSWDTVFTLEGELRDRKVAYSRNHPVGDFVKALPTLAVRPIADDVRNELSQFEHEIRRVDFELPDEIDDFRFWPLGLPGLQNRPIPSDIRRILVVAPFVTGDQLSALSAGADEAILVSRRECLDQVDRDTLRMFDEVFCLSPSADVRTPEDIEAESADALPQSGLHAKLYVADDGWDAHVWTGSANATSAAFRLNIEFLIELIGKKRLWGIDALLARGDGQASFRDLLEPYVCSDQPHAVDPISEELDALIEHIRILLGRAPLAVRIEPDTATGEYKLRLRKSDATRIEIPRDVTVHARPITLHEQAARDLSSADADLAVFSPVSLPAITPFIAFQVCATRDDVTRESSFVLSLPLEGPPADRQQRLLGILLENKAAVLRFLMLLLSDPREDPIGLYGIATPETWTVQSNPALEFANGTLLESLMRALDRDPRRLDHVARLVSDLAATPEGARRLPDGFQQIWSPIWNARQELAK